MTTEAHILRTANRKRRQESESKRHHTPESWPESESSQAGGGKQVSERLDGKQSQATRVTKVENPRE